MPVTTRPPEVVLDGLGVGDATATLRFWRDADGKSHGEITRQSGTLHLLRLPPLESVTAKVSDRLRALVNTLVH